MKFRWFRNFLKGCSLTTALFVFTACYGTPQGYKMEEPADEEEIVSEVTEQDSTVTVDDAQTEKTASAEPEEGKG